MARYSLTFFGGIMSYPSFYKEFHDLNTATTTGGLKANNSLLQGVANGMTNLGGAFACFIVLYFGNRLGRRKMSFIGAIIAIVGTVIFCTSYSFAQILVSRCKSPARRPFETWKIADIQSSRVLESESVLPLFQCGSLSSPLLRTVRLTSSSTASWSLGVS